MKLEIVKEGKHVEVRTARGALAYDIKLTASGDGLQIRAVDPMGPRYSGTLMVIPESSNGLVVKQRSTR